MRCHHCPAVLTVPTDRHGRPDLWDVLDHGWSIVPISPADEYYCQEHT